MGNKLFIVSLDWHVVLSYLPSTSFPSASLSDTHFHADWLLDWSLTPMWA